MYNIKHKILAISMASILILSGCGNNSSDDKATAAFSSSISEFTDYLNEANERINSLDTTSKESCDELLSILDEMEGEFNKLAELEIPDTYSGIASFAKGASNNMTSAVSYYHSIYEGDEFDYDDSQKAYEYYMRAMLEVECMGYLLANEDIPEGLLDEVGIHLTVHDESSDESILSKWLGESTDTSDEADNANGDVEIVSD
jgi:hypothetical protein